MVIANPPTSAFEERSEEDEGRRGRTLTNRLSSMILLTIEVRVYAVESSSLVALPMMMMSSFPFSVKS
jgi:hypothetical protein